MGHQVATQGFIGTLIPTMIQEVAPGDTWSGKSGILVRFSPLKRALLMDMHVDQFTFYVPHRLVASNWEDFIAAGPQVTPLFDLPTVEITSPTQTDQLAGLFVPPYEGAATENDFSISALRLFAYNLIWNEYFRDELDDTRDPTDLPGVTNAYVNYKKDYWTTLRAQTGFADPIHFAQVQPADQVSALSILEAIARQKIATKRATYGTRYIDILRSYGVNVNYQMLQRPELVAMGRGSINVTDVVSTSNVTGNEGDLGSMAGHGISGTRLKLRRKSFPEHGTLMSFCIVRPVHSDHRFVDWFDTPRDYTSFYDPGLVPLPPVRVGRGDIAPTVPSAQRDFLLGYQQWGNWYRSAMSRVHANLAEWTGQTGVDIDTLLPDDVRNIDFAAFNDLFTETDFGHFQISCTHALRAARALPRANPAAGVSSPSRPMSG